MKRRNALKTKGAVTLGLLGLMGLASLQAQAGPTFRVGGADIPVMGGLVGIGGSIQADPLLNLHILPVDDNDIIYTDGGSTLQNFINNNVVGTGGALDPLAAGQTWTGEFLNNPDDNGSFGPFLFEASYGSNNPGQISGFLTLHYTEGASTDVQTVVIPFDSTVGGGNGGNDGGGSITPEPGSLGLLLGGFAATGSVFAARRRKNKKS